MTKVINDEKLVDWAYRSLEFHMQTPESLEFLNRQLPLPNWVLHPHPLGKVLVVGNKEFYLQLFDNRLETLEHSIAECLLEKPERLKIN